MSGTADFEFKRATISWDNEVKSVATELVNQGVPPYDAIEQAVKEVSRRRRKRSIAADLLDP